MASSLSPQLFDVMFLGYKGCVHGFICGCVVGVVLLTCLWVCVFGCVCVRVVVGCDGQIITILRCLEWVDVWILQKK